MTDELPFSKERFERLQQAARSAQIMNYTPYSNFVVLAAVETADGCYYGGSNVENVAYTPTKHAEENAILVALAGGALARNGREWLTAIYIESAAADAAPCGGCRQFINEFAHEDAVWVKFHAESGAVLSRPFRDLLPFDFGPRHLGK